MLCYPREGQFAAQTIASCRHDPVDCACGANWAERCVTVHRPFHYYVCQRYLLAVIEMQLFVAIVWVGDFIGKSHFLVLVLMMLLLLTMMMRIVMVIFILMIANGFMMTMMIFAVILLLCSSVKDDTCVCDLFLFNSPAAWAAACCLQGFHLVYAVFLCDPTTYSFTTDGDGIFNMRKL